MLRVRCVSGLIGEELDPATGRQELHMKLPSEPAPRNGHLRCYSMDEARKRICKKNPRRSVPTDDWRENGKHGGVRGASNLGHSRARISQGLLRSGCQAYEGGSLEASRKGVGCPISGRRPYLDLELGTFGTASKKSRCKLPVSVTRHSSLGPG